MVRLSASDFVSSETGERRQAKHSTSPAAGGRRARPELPEAMETSRARRSVREAAIAQQDYSDPSSQDSLHESVGWTPLEVSTHSPPPPPPPPARRYGRQQTEHRGSEFIAAHFHGNTSHMRVGTHPHYKGNGLVRLAHDTPHNVWWPAAWSARAAHSAAPVLRRGHVRVRHSALYLVYVQIYYLDSQDTVGWVLHRTRAHSDAREALLQCATTALASATTQNPDPPKDKPNSCFSAAALHLSQGDSLAVRNTGGDRHSVMQPEKSFIGLVKLADMEDPEDYY